MAKRVVVDPVTRIEGHLRIEAMLDDRGAIHDAISSGMMWRGIEVILEGRDPRQTPGPSANVSAASAPPCTRWPRCARWKTRCSIRAPKNAEIIRNIMALAQILQDHVIHFYHLHALDWVDVVSALKADPNATAALAQKVSPGWPTSSPGYFREIAGHHPDASSIPASSASLPMPTGDIPPISCRPKPISWRWRTTWKRSSGRRRSSDPHHLRRQEPASQLPGGRRALRHHPGRRKRHQHRAPQPGARPHRRSHPHRGRPLLSRTCWRLRPSIRNGPRWAAACAITWRTAIFRRTASAIRLNSGFPRGVVLNRDLSRRPARGPGRRRPGARGGGPLLVRVPRRQASLHPWDGVTQARLYRAQAALTRSG